MVGTVAPPAVAVDFEQPSAELRRPGRFRAAPPVSRRLRRCQPTGDRQAPSADSTARKIACSAPPGRLVPGLRSTAHRGARTSRMGSLLKRNVLHTAPDSSGAVKSHGDSEVPLPGQVTDPKLTLEKGSMDRKPGIE